MNLRCVWLVLFMDASIDGLLAIEMKSIQKVRRSGSLISGCKLVSSLWDWAGESPPFLLRIIHPFSILLVAFDASLVRKSTEMAAEGCGI